MTSLLIVDNHRPDHDTYREFLSGYELVFCENPKSLRALLKGRDRENGTRIDAAIISWQPTGAEALTLLRRVMSQLPVIAIDRTLNRTIYETARRMGASEFLLKPLEEAALRQAVQQIQGESFLQEIVDQLKDRLVGESREWRDALESLARVIGRGNEQVLILGESGTGKELASRAVHDLGEQNSDPFVAINAAAVQPHLLESELFGHEKGAFTDAREQRQGVFEQCQSGTLFLDEIGELPEPLQANLLRVIQERKFRRLGGNQNLEFLGRLVCATNKNLTEEVREKRFRSDLYHRINTHEVCLPPLRDRHGDWLLLAQHFLDKHGEPEHLQISMPARAVLADCRWPGNARELENVILHCLSHQPVDQILPGHLPPSVLVGQASTNEADATQATFPEAWFEMPQKRAVELMENSFNQRYLPHLLAACRGNVTQAAKKAGLDPKTFRSKWGKADLPEL